MATQHPTSPDDERARMRFTAVTSFPLGDNAASVRLTGELCPYSEPTLRTVLRDVLDSGRSRVQLDLRSLRLCTSHGLDLFDDTDAELRAIGGGLTLAGARGVVRRVLDIVGMRHQALAGDTVPI